MFFSMSPVSARPRSSFQPLRCIAGAVPVVWEIFYAANFFPAQVPAAAALASKSANDIGSPPLVTSWMLDMILHESVWS